MFPASTYQQRRKLLSEKTGKGLLLFPSNAEAPMNYPANTYHFRQDSNFLYFCGIDLPGLFLVIDSEKNHAILFGDELTLEDIVWTGPMPPLQSWAEKSGIADIRPMAKLESFISENQNAGREIHFLPPFRGDNKILLSALLGIPVSSLKDKSSAAFVNAVISLRSIKSEEEIAEIHKAANLTADMHLAAMRFAKPGMREADVYAKVMQTVCKEQAHPSFPVILSVNGQVLHNHAHGNPLTEGRLLLVDAGAESPMHYAGDMTRTFPVAKTFNSDQKLIYQIVLAAQEAAISAIRPGITYKEIHLLAARTIAEGLIAAGLMKGDAGEAVHAGAHALFFPHGLGHMMGLDVHDMEDLGENNVGYSGELERSKQFGLAYLRLAKKLQPGFVLTVEPGIYFIPELFQIWKKDRLHADFIRYEEVEKWMNFGGIRIEEDFLVTPTGSALLGKAAAKSISAVEEERRKAFD